MRAAVFHGPHDVRVEAVPDPDAPPGTRSCWRSFERRSAERTPPSGITARFSAARGRARARVRRTRPRPGAGVTACTSATGSSQAQGSRVGTALVSSWSHEPVRRLPHARPSGRRRARRVRGVPGLICRLVPDACDDDAAAMTQPLAVALHALAASRRHGRDGGGHRCGRYWLLYHRGGIKPRFEGRVVAIDIDADRLADGSGPGSERDRGCLGRDLSDCCST